MNNTIHNDIQLELNLDAVSQTETRSIPSSETPSELPESAPALFPPAESPWEDLGNRRRVKKGHDN